MSIRVQSSISVVGELVLVRAKCIRVLSGLRV